MIPCGDRRSLCAHPKFLCTFFHVEGRDCEDDVPPSFLHINDCGVALEATPFQPSPSLCGECIMRWPR